MAYYLDLNQMHISYLPGMGLRKAEILKKELQIQSYADLLYHFPYKYIDRSKYYKIKEINSQMAYIQIKGHILYFETIGEGTKRRLIAKFNDGEDTIDLVWFKGIAQIKNSLKVGIEYIIFGKPSLFGHTYNIVHPDINKIEEEDKVTGGLSPFYNTTNGMKRHYLNSRAIQNFQYKLLESIHWEVAETLPTYILKQTNLISLSEAIRNIHFPENIEILKKSKLRLKFEELFFIQLNMLQSSLSRKNKLKGLLFSSVGNYFNTFYQDYLPFELTNAQKRVVKEIRKDTCSGQQMNRLLQGDVGSGKTLVGLLIMLIALDNNYQACLMAPTEILAQQHYQTIKSFLNGMSVNISLLTGSTRKKEREKILPQIANGDIQIVIGTHALIEESVVFHSLGLSIIDEQHRFGVAQRSKLWSKSKDFVPHVLIMTATPIPRTLAMTLYGDLDVSVIDELPPGRKPIKTKHCFDNRRKEVLDFLDKEIKIGRQVYVVYPLIEGSEKLDYKSLTEGFDFFKEAFPQYKVCMVHGKMKPKEKEEIMQKFISGENNILLATTVIEVGVNVPNASVMVIENAERFGLSQLHQLRGRVGRGAEQSYCLLVSSHKLSEDSRKRLEIMVSTTDGFQIAEADLKLRGHGDLEGTQQSGIGLDLKIANLGTDGQILQYARDIAEQILQNDPTLKHPENQVLKNRLKVLFSNKINWGLIS